MYKLKLENISKKYNQNFVLNDISFSVKENTTVAILGPSGCGKTTLFNIIAGLVTPNFGRVFIDNIDTTSKMGNVGYMPQNDLLLPHKTIIENVTLPAILAGNSKSEAENRAEKLFDTFLISGIKNKFPHELSGGMRQRVAFLRTYMQNKNLLLLDEPFCALDNLTKNAMYAWFLNITKSLKITTLLITHDIDEAILLADTIHIMSLNKRKITKSIHTQSEKSFDFSFSAEFISIKKHIISFFNDFCYGNIVN